MPALAGIAEAVDDASRHGDVRGRAAADGSLANQELNLSLQHVEGVDVVVVGVGVDALPAGLEAELDCLELGQLGEYAPGRDARALEPLALVSADHDPNIHGSASWRKRSPGAWGPGGSSQGGCPRAPERRFDRDPQAA